MTTSTPMHPNNATASPAISDQDVAFIRLMSAILGQPEEVLLADLLAKKLGKAS